MKKNILFIVVDCLSYKHSFGINRTALIPTLEHLAKNGLFFSNTIASAPFTTPSVASILTGLYPFNHGVQSLGEHKLIEGCVTFAEILKTNGYNTYAEVTGPLYDVIGLNRGFNCYKHRSKKETVFSGWGKNMMSRLEKNHFKKPWFLFLHLFELHRPRQVLSAFNSKKYGKTSYDRALSSVDLWLSSLFDNIDMENTLIVITGDHGENPARNSIHDCFKKILLKSLRSEIIFIKFPQLRRYFIDHGACLYDEIVKIPLIIYSSDKLFSSTKIQYQIRQIDIMPSILDLLDIRIESFIDGASVLPLITGEEKRDRPALIQIGTVRRGDTKLKLEGIRTGEHKFIYGSCNKKLPFELYNLINDPEEKNNIAMKNKEIVERLKKKISDIKTKGMNPNRVINELSKNEMKEIKNKLAELGYFG